MGGPEVSGANQRGAGMKIELTTSPAVADAEAISKGLVDFDHRSIEALESPAEAVAVSVFARDAAGAVKGGLRATCFWHTLHVELLWVSAEARRAGTGSALLAQAERFAVERGYELALHETTRWQSKPFYEKAGYQLMATLPDYPKGHACHFMTERLADAATATAAGTGAS